MDSETNHQTRRRDFLLRCGIGMCAASALAVVNAVLSYLRPGALRQPSTRVVVCQRERMKDDTVLFDKEQKVILVSTPCGLLYAMSAVCPHLGCMTSYRSERRLIECACHGSEFTLRGEPLHGPSPPLLWLDVDVNQRNEVIVDTAAVVPAGTTFET